MESLYEKMATNLESYTFPHYSAEVFANIAERTTQKADNKAPEIPQNERLLRKLTYLVMLDTRIIPYYLQQLCSNGFNALPLYDFGYDVYVQTGANSYINSNLEYFKNVFKECKAVYFTEAPDAKENDMRSINAAIRRFHRQILSTNLSNQIYDFIKTFANYTIKADYEMNCKQIVHKFWAELFAKHFISYEGNILVCDSESNSWRCSDFKTIYRCIQRIPEFNSLYNHVRDDYQWQNVLKSLENDLKNAATNSIPSFTPLFSVLVKYHLLDKINQSEVAVANQNIIADLKKRLRDNFASIKLPAGLGFRDILYHQERKLRNFNKIPSFDLLASALYTITGGRKSCFDELAKLVARIFLGKKMCEKLKIDTSSVTIITTNNFIFIYDFLQSVFTLRMKQDPLVNHRYPSIIDKYTPSQDYVYDGTKCNLIGNRNIRFKSYPQYSDYIFSQKSVDSITNMSYFFNDRENMLTGPIYIDFKVRKCRYNIFDSTPIVEDEFCEKNLDKHDLNDYYHITHYDLTELCNEKLISKFIDDKFYGHLVNININHMKNRSSKLNTKQFVNIAKGKNVLSSYDFFKGELNYTSDSNYVFIQDSFEPNDLFNEICPEVIELSQNIPSRAYLFEQFDDFLPHEKLFVAVDMALYGLDLLLKNNNKSSNDSLPKLMNFTDADTLLRYFFENCCKHVRVTNEITTPTFENATCPKTLDKGLTVFSEALGVNVKFQKMDKSIQEKFVPNGFIIPKDTSAKQLRINKVQGLEDRLKRNGYTEENDGVPKDKTNLWIGIIEKSLDEIKEEAQKLLREQNILREEYESVKKHDEPLSPLDFIKLLSKIGRWEEIYKDSFKVSN